jgi:hypothetical protein
MAKGSKKVYGGKTGKKRCKASHKSCYKVKGGWSGSNK